MTIKRVSAASNATIVGVDAEDGSLHLYVAVEVIHQYLSRSRLTSNANASLYEFENEFLHEYLTAAKEK